jgi:hypothetical protein
MATVAVVAVSERSWKRPFAAGFGFATGKFAPLATDSDSLFTEITAEVGRGAGGVGGVGGTFGGVAPPEPVEPPLEPEPPPELPEPLVPPPFAEGPANGSLVANRENVSSCPGSAVGFTAEIRPEVSVAAGAEARGEPASVGAAAGVTAAGVTGAGVPAVVAAAAATGVEPPPPLSAIIVFTAYAIASARKQQSPIAIFFCFAAFAFAASAGFCRATCRSSRAD